MALIWLLGHLESGTRVSAHRRPHLLMDDYVEPRRQRSPWVLVGAGTTAAVLCAGLIAFRQGNQQLSQMMMRGRVIAQGATVAIMAGTAGLVSMAEKREQDAAGQRNSEELPSR